MDIKLSNKDSVRITNGDILSLNTLFLDVKRYENSNDEYHNETISASCYGMHKVFFLKKDRAFSLFVFNHEDKVHKSDFGYFSDGEIIFTNAELD